MSRTALFHNKQTKTVPFSLIQMDTNEHNSGTRTVRGITGQ